MPFIIKRSPLSGFRAAACPSWMGKRIVAKVMISEFGEFFYAWGRVVSERVDLRVGKVELTLYGGGLWGALSYYDTFEEHCRELAPEERFYVAEL